MIVNALCAEKCATGECLYRICTRRSSALSSSGLRSALAVVKSTANPSRSPNLVAHDANFGATASPSTDGLPNFAPLELASSSLSLLPDLVVSYSHKYFSSTCLVFPRPRLDAIALAPLESVQTRTCALIPRSAVIHCIPRLSAAPVTAA